MRDLFDDDKNESESSDFAQMFEDSMKGVERKLAVGDKIRGEILSVGKEEVFVSTGTVDDGVVLRQELLDAEGLFKHQVGDKLDLFVVQIKNGQTMLSQKPTAKNLADDLEEAYNMGVSVEGKVTESVNGGFRVLLMGKTAFCPMSQMDSRRIDDPTVYLERKFEFVITQFDPRGRNIVVSRRKLLDQQKELSQASFAEDHKPGQLLTGLVTRIEKFGAFIEVAPGLEGLAHISELSWSRVSDPNEVVKVGQQVQVKILKFEDVNGRMNVSLSVKQAAPEPWEKMPAHIHEGAVVEGRVTKCLAFGAFVELAPGIEGLVPLSEMSHAKRVVKSDDIIKEGERVAVLVKEIRPEERRMLLSLKDAGGDPWDMVPVKYPQGAIVRGKVERRESYGLFVRLDEAIVALLPKSQAMDNPEFSFDKAKIGDELTVEIKEVRIEDRRISLAVPRDPNAEVWKGFSAKGGGSGVGSGGLSSKSLGTLGEQFKGLFSADSDPKADAGAAKKKK